MDILRALNEQRLYNSRKSKKYKLLYYISEVIMLFFTILTPVLLTINNLNSLFPGISSGIVLLTKGVSSLFKFQQIWLSSRFLTEELKSEERQYNSGINDYKDLSSVEKEAVLAKKLENIIKIGNKLWFDIISSKEEAK